MPTLIPLVLVPIGLVASIGLGMIVWAVTIYEGIRRTLDVSEMFAFLRGFLGKVWCETLVALLFLVITGFILSVAGLALCFVGVYLTTNWVMLSHYHLMAQTCRLYSQRGGMPLPERGQSNPFGNVEPKPIPSADSAESARSSG